MMHASACSPAASIRAQYEFALHISRDLASVDFDFVSAMLSLSASLPPGLLASATGLQVLYVHYASAQSLE